MVHTYTICEPAIAIAYMIMGKRDILETAGHVLQGYQAMYPLTREEIDLLFDLIGTRLCMSVCMSAMERNRDPDNTYLAVSEQPAWETLEELAHIDLEKARRVFREVTALSR
jgi:Ser/Thr protein kinase RdoA (MazF antagonist)